VSPFLVKRVVEGSTADKAGVQPNWAVKTINGEELTGNFDEDLEWFRDMVNTLPDA